MSLADDIRSRSKKLGENVSINELIQTCLPGAVIGATIQHNGDYVTTITYKKYSFVYSHNKVFSNQDTYGDLDSIKAAFVNWLISATKEYVEDNLTFDEMILLL